MDRGAWWSTVHGLTKSRTWLSDFPPQYVPYKSTGQMELETRPGISWPWPRSTKIPCSHSSPSRPNSNVPSTLKSSPSPHTCGHYPSRLSENWLLICAFLILNCVIFHLANKLGGNFDDCLPATVEDPSDRHWIFSYSFVFCWFSLLHFQIITKTLIHRSEFRPELESRVIWLQNFLLNQ